MDKQKAATASLDPIHAGATLLVAALFAVVLYQVGSDPAVPAKPRWELQALIAFAAVNTLTAMARQLPWQYVISAAVFAALIGTAAHAASQYSGIPFGPFLFGNNAGEQVVRLPWTVPFIWIVALFNSRGVARLILRPWRKMKTYGFWLIGITVGLTTIFDLGMDPFLSWLNHYWLWSPTKLAITWQGAPLINFLGWMVVSLLILAFATPFLIKKKPGQKSASDFHPLVVWAGAMALFALACGRHAGWVPMGLDLAAITAATVMAVRGAKW